ncbi:5'-methylthioadenosine/adenosylhomocysteine nucleosidase [Campylobacter fetus]|uniref:adenosylhomocysteine nucleosidase n=1 Tax=Campylobacter fetus subsp. testudinum TaxID=1507806 RepID=A0AAX0HCC7_CAMFE|nr:5'-methylthioadenosine/adenosylhomocysteine nucleosidase [Campylobacter fetus]AGZ82318.1 multifunctional 5'-methylthioadenosine / S-adenosylhomocysteine nucleosidase / 6-amino-6-deoxyfutalosine hydrolase [Campylobacter fetus subsp. testudinum 03-427]AJB46041.1 S-adenosylhomocysteine nucleosidase [Campylobacter fetus subsp. testudinum]ALV65487.1 multifunctional 5'-methylthioadenosine / S-adenosylhomocysteine nucleosidase / 6-amino-6-deoxyfutalosine hydrolase [Campylobacter fetus subsp. testudi
MKVAILGAMPEEIAPLLSRLQNYETIKYAKNEFYLAKYKNHELVIAYSKIGKVNSTLTATLMVEKFGCEILLFTGVAGALNEKLKIGDIIYATSTAQHDLDISAFGHPYGYVPGINVYEKTDEKLNNIAKKVATKNGVNLVSGVIVSGDQFICDPVKKEWIKSTFDADAVEMEGASVGQVCATLGVPYFLMRAISDEAGGGAEIDFDKFVVEVANTSAKFVLDMVEYL